MQLRPYGQGREGLRLPSTWPRFGGMTCAASPSSVTAPRPHSRTGRAKMPCSSSVAGSAAFTKSTTCAGKPLKPSRNLATPATASHLDAHGCVDSPCVPVRSPCQRRCWHVADAPRNGCTSSPRTDRQTTKTKCLFCITTLARAHCGLGTLSATVRTERCGPAHRGSPPPRRSTGGAQTLSGAPLAMGAGPIAT